MLCYKKLYYLNSYQVRLYTVFHVSHLKGALSNTLRAFPFHFLLESGFVKINVTYSGFSSAVLLPPNFFPF